MTEPPNNVLQFERPRMSDDEHAKVRNYYFGECGDGKGFWPARHRWIVNPSAKGSTCKWCGLAKETT